MQVCPKCGKLISDNKYARHLRRCGTSHKHQTRPLFSPSATPEFYWGRYSGGYTPKHERREKNRHNLLTYGLVALVVVVFVAIIIKFLA